MVVAIETAGQEHRRQRASHLRWIRLGDLRPARAQREFIPSWAHTLAANFNLEGMGYITVSLRNGIPFIIDGQHRVEALREIGFSEDDTVQCEVYEGLTEQQEAELFLERNNGKAVGALPKFRSAVLAERPAEQEIDRIVRALGLSIGKAGRREALTYPRISAVGTLRKVYQRSGVHGLSKTLRVIRDAYGHAGFDAPVIDGIGLLVQRYGDALNEERLVTALTNASGGLTGLLTQAAKTRAIMGQSVPQCIAATAVGLYNRSSGSHRGKLAPWWQESAA